MNARLLNGIPVGGKWRCDAIRPAQDEADATGLAQTQFYHPDYGWTCASACAPILEKLRRDRKTELSVTWLPTNYFA